MYCKKLKRKAQRGFVSVALAMGILVLGLVAVSNSSMMNEGATISANNVSHDRASLYALAGLEYALRQIDQGGDPTGTKSFDHGSAVITISGNQVTSQGISGDARVTQNVTTPVSGSCVSMTCNNFHSDGTDLIGLRISKACLARPTIARMKVQMSPDNGEKFTTIRYNGSDIFTDATGVGHDEWMDVTDTLIVAEPSPSEFDYLRLSAPINGGKNLTFVVEFIDHTTAQIACADGTASAVCGNGQPEYGEECDDGNTNNGDGCSTNCTIEENFTCSGAPSTCHTTVGCGNGVLDANEVCDDQNSNNGDGCSAACQIETGYTCSGTPSACISPPSAVCGNSNIESGEACDDGNMVAGDGCATNCSVENNYTCSGTPSTCSVTVPPPPTAVCGNGNVESGESCDDGNVTEGDGCSSNCGIETGYTCNGTPSVCHLVNTAVCGNGGVETGESCDDGNTANGDGCSSNCAVETGFTCTGSPTSSCAAVSTCGNGTKEGSESCDDGNTSNSDGCSSQCLVESGFTCSGTPRSTCVPNGPYCGDGQIGASEQCDDGNQNNGDGCSSACNLESGYTCSGAPSTCISNSQKYCICHNTGSNNNPYNTISISGNAVCAHKAQHGDTPGPCNGDPVSACKGDPTLPANFVCAGAPNPSCGNGVPESPETCDDGNTSSGDGCSTTCVVEPNYTCSGNPSTCVSTPTPPATNVVTTNNGNVTVAKNCTSELKVVCTDITYGAGGPKIPVKMNRAKNGSYFNNWMFNNKAVKAGDLYSEAVGSTQNVTYKVKGNAQYGSFNATYESSNTNQVKTLMNGSTVPPWQGFGGQQPVSACVAPYVNTQTGKIQLANNQAIFLFELGVNTAQNPNSTAIDFQDLVVLLTAKNCQ